MLLSANILGAIFALTSAIIWGAGDFTGGLASRRSNQFLVLVISALSGLLITVLTALIWREPLPTTKGILFAALGGAAGALGIAALYRALSWGHAAIIAPTAAVTSTALPVIFNGITRGLPAPMQLLGFAIAAFGIWMLSAEAKNTTNVSRREILVAALSGAGFGLFFIFLGQVEPGFVFTPVIVARFVTLGIGLLLVKINHLPLPSLRSNLPALLAGVLDAGGNIFYVLANQFTRLDIAAVLSSLYPASTVILASAILKQTVSLKQWAGVLVCLAAIVLITL